MSVPVLVEGRSCLFSEGMWFKAIISTYKFIYIDVGSNGRASDAGVYRHSSLSRALEEGFLDIPTGTHLVSDTNAAPMTSVADDAFPLKPYIMKPYPGRGLDRHRRIFKYRLSRAR